ncbi:MAG: tetratricopeptide repeat protein [Capsulimonadales bacterium]|nr:tetratricopeptide repeat protein [Capsulimonadales bacterium]
MTSSVKMESAPTKPASAPPANQGRLRILVGVLLACSVVLFAVWWQGRRPPAPPESAPPETRRAYWQKRIRTDVSDTEAYLRLGILDERTGFFTSAVKYLQAARALGAPDAEVCGPLGRALTQLARDEEALPELQKARELNPDSATAAANLAGLYVNQERSDLAADVLRNFVTAHTDLTAADSNRIGLALLECGDPTTARTLAEKQLSRADDPISRSIAARGALAAKDYATARTHLEAVLKVEPNDTGALYLYGNVLDALGDGEEALKAWKRAVDLNPRAVDIYERIGNAYAERKDFRRAAVAFVGLATRAPTGRTAVMASLSLARIGEKERAAYWRAVAAGFTANFPEALRHAKIAAASKDPVTRRLGLQAMAEAYRGMRQREPYLATMKQVTAGGSPEDKILMASAYRQADRHEDRTRLLEEVAKTAPPERRSSVLYSLGIAYRTRGMRDQAEKALEEAIALDPKNVGALTELGSLYYDRRAMEGRLAKAIEVWERARTLAPDDAAHWEHLGTAYTAAKQPGRAAQYLEHAIDLEPGHGPAYFELSKAYENLGDSRSAAQFRSLYAKYVTYEQNRQTLRTRAYRPGATAADTKTYADLMAKIGALEDAAQWYEKTLVLAPKDDAVRRRLIGIYRKLRRVDRIASLSEPPPTVREAKK